MAKPKTKSPKEKKKNNTIAKRSMGNKPPIVHHITAENISGINGNINIAGRDIGNNQFTVGLSADEIAQLFDGLYAYIETRQNSTSAEKEALQSEVEKIQSNVSEITLKNKKASEGFMLRRFRNIARMGPDILDVVIKTLSNPALGIAVMVNKIAKKAKEEAR